jgi:DNA polymerase-3 subunit alpha
MINRSGAAASASKDIPIDDVLTYKLYVARRHVGVFQVESAGMRRALVDHEARPLRGHHRAGGALSPGSDGEHPAVQRPQARRRRDRRYPHEDAEQGDETYGIIVYQEQVMQIAQVLSGYSLGEADMLRRAMGKKIKAEMDKQRARFREGAIKNGLKKSLADTIFDLLAKFANYGFNKSHAATYALVSYQTAYLKAHYPHEFLAATMTSTWAIPTS